MIDISKMTDVQRKDHKKSKLRRYLEPRMDVPNYRGVIKALVMGDTAMIDKIKQRYADLDALLSDVEVRIDSATTIEEEDAVYAELDKRKIAQIDTAIFGAQIKDVTF